jgi:hypothetical protein
MTRFTDGPELTLSDLRQLITDSVSLADKGQDLSAAICRISGYQFLFGDLQKDPNNRLPETEETAFRLIDLGRTMVDPNPSSKEGDSKIPSAYTYFGQFIDHDLTRQMRLPGDRLKSCMRPLSDEMIVLLTNARSPSFDLDCVYGPPTEPGTPYKIPRDGEKLVIKRAQDGPPFSDLPRVETPGQVHYALIGDRRNDEHFIISQMHVAFLRAHNALVDNKMSFETAQTTLRRIYQYIAVNDYLPRIADPVIVKDVLSGAWNVFDSSRMNIPLEFSVAAFRTAHSMIRNVYNYNKHLEDIGVVSLFLPGPLVEFQQILATWIIDWARFFNGTNMARLLSPKLAPDLRFVDTRTGFDLATVDLLKGYLYRLPTGEAVARFLGFTPMSFSEIAEVTTPEQQKALTFGGFRNRTPLWFYLLCEAAATKDGRLGRVGSIIVASVIIGLIRKSEDSYLKILGWTPFKKGPVFNLDHLFQFAGVLPNDD